MKQEWLNLENAYLSQFAVKSADTKGREINEESCRIRTEFQRDRDRIIHSKAFRRMKQKTQVFIAPEGDHYRTRLTHTLEVSQIARTIARALRLNEDLVEAISLGHDLGHTPFGHTGERILNNLNPDGFSHNENSLRVCRFLENDGEGLNLTAEVLDGILNHKMSGNPFTLEGKIVSFADRIAYLNHDIDDAERAGLLDVSLIPQNCNIVLGETKKERINNLIFDIIENSYNKSYIAQSNDFSLAMNELRNFMFSTVYEHSVAKSNEIMSERLIGVLFDYYLKNIDKLPVFYKKLIEKEGEKNSITYYIASMTDGFVIKEFNNIFIPKHWTIL